MISLWEGKIDEVKKNLVSDIFTIYCKKLKEIRDVILEINMNDL